MRAEAQLRLARVLGAMGRTVEGLAALGEARSWNARGGSAATAAGTAAQIDLEESELRRRESPGAAEALADRAVKRLAALRRPLERVVAILARARAHLASGEEAEAEEDLGRVLRLMGDEEAGIEEPRFRESFAAAAQGFFDEWIEVRSRRADAALATLEAIERARDLASMPLNAGRGRVSMARLRASRGCPRTSRWSSWGWSAAGSSAGCCGEAGSSCGRRRSTVRRWRLRWVGSARRCRRI